MATGTDTVEAGTGNLKTKNFSGFVVGGEDLWKSVSANFFQTGRTRPECQFGTLDSWVGLGGIEEGQGLIQVGTEIRVQEDSKDYQSFFNIIPAGKTHNNIPLDVKIHPGDEIHASVSYNPAADTARLLLLNKDDPRRSAFYSGVPQQKLLRR